MVEFRVAHQLVSKGRKRFIIPLLYEGLEVDELEPDLKQYIETHTYIECKDKVKFRY